MAAIDRMLCQAAEHFCISVRRRYLFVYMLGKAQRSKLFSYPNTPTKETLKDVMVDLAKTEVDDCRKHKKSEREIKRCERALEITRKQSLNAML